MRWNCYAFDRNGQRLIVDLGLTRNEAEQRCEYEAQFLRDQFHLPLVRYGDTWMDKDFSPRVGMHSVDFDPFALCNDAVVWLPEPVIYLNYEKSVHNGKINYMD